MAYAIAIQALGDPTRRSIFERLRTGPRAVGELARELPVSRPAVSQHLRVLKEAGLVTEQRNGTRRIYGVDAASVAELRDYFDGFWSDALESFKRAVEPGGREEEVSMTETTEAVRKSVLVEADAETAFRVFTDKIQSWWPLEKYGIFGEDAEALSFRDDQIVESAKDGREAVWGKIVAWQPPTRLHFTWRPGFDADTPDTEVEVTFSAEGEGTRVELVHTGWEKLPDGAKSRAGYDGGWDGVLEAYRQAV